MTNIAVDKENLETKAKSISDLVARFDEQLALLKAGALKVPTGWNGTDSITFTGSLSSYIDELTTVRNAMAEYLTSFNTTPGNIKSTSDKYANLLGGE